LLKPIEEYARHAEITAFKTKIGNIDQFLKTVSSKKPPDTEIQFFDADLVATWQHLYFAALNALTAFKNNENKSRTIAMETMLYASAQRQIQKATTLMGIKPTTNQVAVLIIGKNAEETISALTTVSKLIGVKRDDAILELSNEKMAFIQTAFGISDIELHTIVKKKDLQGALVDLVIERMALVATQK